MKVPSSVLLLVGSPNKEHSTSYSLGSYLMERMKEHGAIIDVLFLIDATSDSGRMEGAIQKMMAADLVILAAPIYVDSLPSPVMKFMENAYAWRGPGSLAGKHILGIVNSAFPERVQSECGMRIMHEFALDLGLAWAGGLILPEGPMLGGQRLEDLGGTARRVKQALELTAKAIMTGNDTPKEAKDMMAKPMAPAWIYNMVANRRFRQRAAKNGAKSRMFDRPHA